MTDRGGFGRVTGPGTDYVVIGGQLAVTLIQMGEDFEDAAEHFLETDSQEHGFDDFLAEFTVVVPDNTNPGVILDKDLVYGYGLTCMRVIQDRQGATYGLRYRLGLGKHDDEIHPEWNGANIGLDEGWYIFHRVEPVTITAYGYVE